MSGLPLVVVVNTAEEEKLAEKEDVKHVEKEDVKLVENESINLKEKIEYI